MKKTENDLADILTRMLDNAAAAMPQPNFAAVAAAGTPVLTQPIPQDRFRWGWWLTGTAAISAICLLVFSLSFSLASSDAMAKDEISVLVDSICTPEVSHVPSVLDGETTDKKSSSVPELDLFESASTDQ